jgi:hypothetical protein
MSLFSFSNTKKGLTTDFTVGEMGGKIPRQIKEKVIRQWLQGTRRSTIAKDNGIGGPLLRKFTGRVLWHGTLQATSTFIKWKRARTSCCVFYNTLEENGRWWSKSISSGTYRSDPATYCFKHEISFATIIQSGYKAFSLEKEHGVPVKMSQAHIARAKKTRDDLLDESQKRPRMMQDEQSEYETIKGKLKNANWSIHG